mgnify:CR=1 FL=1|tara:strand:- start:965 stop:2386 length:1422 start_codon:yes stop_codon:yes gene_type:complete
MPLILGAQSAIASGFTVENSCRFNSGDSAYMYKTFGTATDADKWTFSVWIKRAAPYNTAAAQKILNAYRDGNGYQMIQTGGSVGNSVNTYNHDTSGGTADVTAEGKAQFMDPAGWMHIVFMWDAAESVTTDRIQLWINGVRLDADSLTSVQFPSINQAGIINSAIVHQLGAVQSPAQYFNGYMSEVVFLDGVADSPVDTLGAFNADSPNFWQPLDPSDLTFGTNGFYLDFKDSANLGNDANGGTDFTTVNFTAADQGTDSPTNSFSTFNPLIRLGAHSDISEGNCKNTLSGAGYESIWSTMMVTKGKWYCEFKYIAGSHQYTAILGENLVNDYYENVVGGVPNVAYNHAGNKQIDGVQSAYGATYTTGDIIGVALDYDNNYIYFSKNGTFQDSGDPTSGATGTGGIALPSTTHAYAFGVSKYASAGSVGANFGGCSGFDVSSANQDGNGYGNFEYAVPSGYYALCTKNLAEFG